MPQKVWHLNQECFRAAFFEKNLLVVFGDVLAAHAEIGDSAVAFVVEQHVVELQVAIHDLALVEKLQARVDFCRVKSRNFSPEKSAEKRVENDEELREDAFLLNPVHQVATGQVLHHEIEIRVVLQRRHQMRQVRMFARQFEHSLLDRCRQDIPVCHHCMLLHCFYSAS